MYGNSIKEEKTRSSGSQGDDLRLYDSEMRASCEEARTKREYCIMKNSHDREVPCLQTSA